MTTSQYTSKPVTACEVCGNPLKSGKSFCSPKCRGLFRKQSRVNCVCAQCGKEFWKYPSEIKRGGGSYCSNQCTGIARTTKVECFCERCGKSFFVKPAHLKAGKGKFCGNECAGLAKRNRVDRICLQCGTQFKIDPSRVERGGGKFCSPKCSTTYHRGKNNSAWRGGNKVKNRGVNWSTQRKLAYARDKGECQYCGKKPQKGKNKFQVHHIKPFRDFNGDYLSANLLTNLITLCPSCHKFAENGKIIIQPYLF